MINKIKLAYFPYSDHDGLLVQLNLLGPGCGPGTWKMNYAVVQSVTFKKVFKSFWRSWRLKKQEFVSLLDWWEVTKIKSLTIDVSKQLKDPENVICNKTMRKGS